MSLLFGGNTQFSNSVIQMKFMNERLLSGNQPNHKNHSLIMFGNIPGRLKTKLFGDDDNPSVK